MTGAGWIVRDAIPGRDAAACAEIYAPFVRDTVVSFEEEAPSAEEFEGRIRSTQATHPWLVLEDASVVVGYAYASTHRTRASYRWAADVTVYIGPSHRGMGVGRRLYTELLDRLRAQRFQVACAGITLPNDASVGLHERFGMTKVAHFPEVGFKFGRWIDVGYWQRVFRP